MGKVIPCITSKEEEFIKEQKIFFVATAALAKDHHVSVSPKANNGTFQIFNPTTIMYADYTGSGAETAAHIIQNQRMTIMFCNIQSGLPNILRLFGTAEIVLKENISSTIRNKFPHHVMTDIGLRAIYILHIHRISTSCGYSLPIMEFQKFRTTLQDVTKTNGVEGAYNYITTHNSFSIDGLPSLGLLRKDAPTVVPVLENGYIHGKVVEDVENKGSNTNDNKMKKLVLQQYHPSLLSKQLHVRVQDLIILAIIVLFTGIVIGHVITQYYMLYS